jgi:LmbE family N-acetylglucosaminyl deacetylase
VIVILSPHLDDAVLSCWSVLTGSDEVDVVNVFTGAPGAESVPHLGELLTGGTDPVARIRERAEEDRAALSLADARPHNLGLLEHPHAPSRRFPFTRRGAERRIAEISNAISPHLEGEPHVYVPAALGAHPDHVLVRELGCRLVRDGKRVSFYADQPYCYAYGWPHWVTGEEPDAYLDVEGVWQHELASATVSFEELRAEVVPLGEAHADKLRALRLYRTQFSVLEGGANRRVSNPDLSGWEVFWHATTGGAQVADGLS